jgi:hypothetical protein
MSGRHLLVWTLPPRQCSGNDPNRTARRLSAPALLVSTSLVLLVGAGPLSAQPRPEAPAQAVVTGVVLDDFGRSIRGAEVLAGPVRALTGNDGRFRIRLLPALDKASSYAPLDTCRERS